MLPIDSLLHGINWTWNSYLALTELKLIFWIAFKTFTLYFFTYMNEMVIQFKLVSRESENIIHKCYTVMSTTRVVFQRVAIFLKYSTASPATAHDLYAPMFSRSLPYLVSAHLRRYVTVVTSFDLN